MTQPTAAGELAGRVAIVTGGGSGIGAAVADLMASAGAIPVLFDIKPEAGEATAAAITKRTGRPVSSIVVDVTDRDWVNRAVAEVESAHGRVDILVNSAGWNQFRAPEELDQEIWRRIISINLDGSWNTCAAVMPIMIRRGSGKIVNIGSSAALLAIPHAVPYSAAKHGLIGMTRSVAMELGTTGIRVNVVCPGAVDTPMVSDASAKAGFDIAASLSR
jgi:NAD(P)-dependent dehydrogenase (short-subunit alcohol dehydrogenase family)